MSSIKPKREFVVGERVACHVFNDRVRIGKIFKISGDILSLAFEDHGTTAARKKTCRHLKSPKPEKIVLDGVSWHQIDHIVFPKDGSDFVWTTLLGKRTRVTVEVIE